MKKTTLQRLGDFALFLVVAVGVITTVALFTNTFKEPVALIAMVIIVIPTVIAMISGAPFVPTPMPRVKKMLELAKIKPGEKVYDIGCGDGRIVYLAAKDYQAKATGFELSPLVYCLALVRKLFWRSKAKILFTDFRHRDLSDADVVLCYLMPQPLAKLQAKLEKELKKGARVVSYAFHIGTWEPSFVEEKDAANNLSRILIYTKK